MPTLRDFDAARFLREDWQRQPALIRDPWQRWANPLEPDELAGLACEPEIESRIVQATASGEWRLEHGPFSPDRFATLGASAWTLLVQAVDHHVPAVAELIAPFRFIPDWRIDDVMVSYAVDGGGVGPHFDQYDVFLVQGLGRRRWRVGPRCDDSSPLLPHDGLRLLADFTPTAEWVLEPGDILYVPPGFAHEGVALGDDCMTYSVGFRAPSRSELVMGWADHIADMLRDDDRYTDGMLDPHANPGEITPAAVDRLHAMVTGALNDRAAFAAWFGVHATAPKDARIDWAPDSAVDPAELARLASAGARIARNPASRFAFVRGEAGAATLFVDGVDYACAGAAAHAAAAMCSENTFVLDSATAAEPAVIGLLAQLFDTGALAFADDA